MSTKFYYFDGRGIGEPIRWILAHGGIDFEDIRIPYNAFPPTLPADIQSKSRWGQVPLLEFEGKSLAQSNAITRYLARKAKLVPGDDYQAALCDEYVDTVKDFLLAFYDAFKSENRDEKIEGFFQTSKTKYLDVFESIIKVNGGQHLVGSNMTWADIALAFALDHFVQLVNIDLTLGYPNLQNVKNNVVNSSKIKAWLEKRPKTKY